MAPIVDYKKLYEEQLKKNQELESKVLNRDIRAGPFDIKVNKAYINEFLEMKNIDVEENDMAVMNSNSNMKSSFFDLLCELVLSKEN